MKNGDSSLGLINNPTQVPLGIPHDDEWKHT